MIIRYIVGTLLIVIPAGVGIYYAIMEFGWKEILVMLGIIAGVMIAIFGLYLLVT